MTDLKRLRVCCVEAGCHKSIETHLSSLSPSIWSNPFSAKAKGESSSDGFSPLFSLALSSWLARSQKIEISSSLFLSPAPLFEGPGAAGRHLSTLHPPVSHLQSCQFGLIALIGTVGVSAAGLWCRGKGGEVVISLTVVAENHARPRERRRRRPRSTKVPVISHSHYAKFPCQSLSLTSSSCSSSPPLLLLVPMAITTLLLASQFCCPPPQSLLPPPSLLPSSRSPLGKACLIEVSCSSALVHDQCCFALACTS